VRCRERPDALDRPDGDDYLRFARWLVEHGRLSEDDGTARWRPPRDGETPRTKWPRKGQPEPAGDNLPGEPDSDWQTACVQRLQHAHWRLIMRGAWARARRGLVRAAGSGRELRSQMRVSSAIESWRPWGQWSGASSSPEAQWYWMFLWPLW
jgi:hypothetical protein